MTANVALKDVPSQSGRKVDATVRFNPRDAADHARWLTATSWQGGGLVVDRLKRVSEGVYRTTQPVPVNGDWKTLIRFHSGRSLQGLPVYLPADSAIPVPGVPAKDRVHAHVRQGQEDPPTRVQEQVGDRAAARLRDRAGHHAGPPGDAGVGARPPGPRGRRAAERASGGTGELTRRPGGDGMTIDRDLEPRQIELHGHPVTYHCVGEGPALVLIHGITSSSQTWRVGDPGAGRAPHGDRARPARPRRVGQAARGLLARRLRQRRARPAARARARRGDGGRPLARRRHRDAVRLPVPRARASAWCWSPAAAWAARSTRSCARRPCPEPSSCSRCCGPPARRRSGVGDCSAASGWRPSADLRGIGRGLRLARRGRRAPRVPAHRRARSWTSRGQRVSATDRLYLAAEMPTLIVWGERDPMIPVAHAHAAHAAMPHSRLEVFQEAGHFPFNDDPQRFVNVLLDFMAHTKPAKFDGGPDPPAARRAWARAQGQSGRPRPRCAPNLGGRVPRRPRRGRPPAPAARTRSRRAPSRPPSGLTASSPSRAVRRACLRGRGARAASPAGFVSWVALNFAFAAGPGRLSRRSQPPRSCPESIRAPRLMTTRRLRVAEVTVRRPSRRTL